MFDPNADVQVVEGIQFEVSPAKRWALIGSWWPLQFTIGFQAETNVRNVEYQSIVTFKLGWPFIKAQKSYLYQKI